MARPRSVPRVTPPGFRATGLGLGAKLPDFPATEALATGVMVNQGRAKKDGFLYRLPLFVLGVQTAYSVAGSYGQTSSSRTFYPMNYSQDVLNISLLFANSFEYDKMVDFVRQHHWDALDTFVDDPNNGTHGVTSNAVEFKLFPYYVQAGKNSRGQQVYREIYGGIPGNFNAASSNGTHVAGYILGCAAGVERFQFARSMDLQLKISYDFLEDHPQTSALTNKILQDNVLNGLATNLYGRKNGHVIAPLPVNNLGQVIQGDAAAGASAADAADAMWNDAKINQLEHSGIN